MSARRTALLVVLVTGCVVAQVAVAPRLRLFGVVPDLGLVLALALAYHDTPETAALAGFAAGLGFDLFLQTPVGLNAFAYAATGYLAGIAQTSLLRSAWWVAPGLGGVGGLVGGSLFAIVGVLAGVDALLHRHTLAVILLAALYDLLVAPLAFALVGAGLRRTRSRRRPAPFVL